MATDDATSFNDGAFYYTTDGAETIFGAIRGSPDAILVFDSLGDFRAEIRYDSYTPTADKVTNEYPYYGIMGIVDLGFAKYAIAVTNKELAAKVKWRSVWRITAVKMVPLFRKAVMTLDEEEHERINLDSILRLTTSGQFFFSVDVDLTNGPQNTVVRQYRASTEQEYESILQKLNHRFLFNYHVLKPLMSVATFPFILPVICGYVGSASLAVQSESVHLAVISRFAFNRAGSRFRRGIDDKGDCAVEVETEAIVFFRKRVSAFRVLRGSVPLKWGLLYTDGGSRLDLSEATTSSSRDAFRLHLERLQRHYGKDVAIVDLLHLDESDQRLLGESFEKAIIEYNRMSRDTLDYFHFDGKRIQHDLRYVGHIMKELQKPMARQGFFSCATDIRDRYIGGCNVQNGVFRINGFDCIDTTNIVQGEILKQMIVRMIKAEYPTAAITPQISSRVSHLFTDNADHVARYYVGTSARHTSLMSSNSWLWRKVTQPIRALKNRAISMIRSYLMVFQEDHRQEAFEVFLGEELKTTDDSIETVGITVVQEDRPEDPERRFRLTILRRRRVALHENSQSTPIALMLLLRRLLAPREVKGVGTFCSAAGWLGTYTVLRRVGAIRPGVLNRNRRRSLATLQDLPPEVVTIARPKKGRAVHKSASGSLASRARIM
ncbi:Phosphatidylinositide phosphatase SAC1 [Irineochytrium annulatum]|nr:Phosphatidylinositide phosphatase SAC1 [Irineochytrium annulatum]